MTPAPAAARTVGESLAAAERLLHDAGVKEATREVHEMYAALVLGATSRAFLDRDMPITPLQHQRLQAAAAQRATGTPQAYAVGRANFRGHWLAVDQRVLIPRAETEGLVDIVIEWAARWKVGKSASEARPSTTYPLTDLPTVADIGTGSGAIAIALALEAPVAGVIATDVSGEALAVALENVAATGTQERVALRKGPLLEPLLGEVMDAIVCNLPYVTSLEFDWLDPSVREYEPRVAIDGGPDGLVLIRQLVAAAPASLTPGGLLAMETDAGRADATAEVVQQTGNFEHVEVRDDSFGRPRYVTAVKTER